MSGSPKAAEIRLRALEEQRLVEERQRKAEEERRHREEVERRARIALEKQLRAILLDEAARLRAAVVALRGATNEASVPGGLPHIEAHIDLVVANAGGSPESVNAALGQVRAAARSLTALAGHVADQAAALVTERDAIRREASAEAARLRVASISEEATRASAIVTGTTELSVRLAGMESDEVTMAWSGADIRAIHEELSSLADSPTPLVLVAEMNARLDAAFERAQDRQLAEERRAYIVAALQDGLREQGFQVGEARLVGAVFDSEVAFRAVRADRRWVDVNVPVEGHVYYDVDGTDRVTERGSDRLAYTRCDETEARLEELHTDLAKRFGITAGDLFWESKDPHRERRSANSLPSGGPLATRERG